MVIPWARKKKKLVGGLKATPLKNMSEFVNWDDMTSTQHFFLEHHPNGNQPTNQPFIIINHHETTITHHETTINHHVFDTFSACLAPSAVLAEVCEEP